MVLRATEIGHDRNLGDAPESLLRNLPATAWPARLPALLKLVLTGLILGAFGCGSNIEGKPCADIRDCPTGYACVENRCTLVDIDNPTADAAQNMDGAGSAADAGVTGDGNSGLEGDAGFGAVGCTLPPFIGAINPG